MQQQQQPAHSGGSGNAAPGAVQPVGAPALGSAAGRTRVNQPPQNVPGLVKPRFIPVQGHDQVATVPATTSGSSSVAGCPATPPPSPLGEFQLHSGGCIPAGAQRRPFIMAFPHESHRVYVFDWPGRPGSNKKLVAYGGLTSAALHAMSTHMAAAAALLAKSVPEVRPTFVGSQSFPFPKGNFHLSGPVHHDSAGTLPLPYVLSFIGSLAAYSVELFLEPGMGTARKLVAIGGLSSRGLEALSGCLRDYHAARAAESASSGQLYLPPAGSSSPMDEFLTSGLGWILTAVAPPQVLPGGFPSASSAVAVGPPLGPVKIAAPLMDAHNYLEHHMRQKADKKRLHDQSEEYGGKIAFSEREVKRRDEEYNATGSSTFPAYDSLGSQVQSWEIVGLGGFAAGTSSLLGTGPRDPRAITFGASKSDTSSGGLFGCGADGSFTFETRPICLGAVAAIATGAIKAGVFPLTVAPPTVPAHHDSPRRMAGSLRSLQKRPAFLAIKLGGSLYWIPETGMFALKIGTRGTLYYHFTGTFEDGYLEFVQESNGELLLDARVQRGQTVRLLNDKAVSFKCVNQVLPIEISSPVIADHGRWVFVPTDCKECVRLWTGLSTASKALPAHVSSKT